MPFYVCAWKMHSLSPEPRDHFPPSPLWGSDLSPFKPGACPSSNLQPFLPLPFRTLCSAVLAQLVLVDSGAGLGVVYKVLDTE